MLLTILTTSEAHSTANFKPFFALEFMDLERINLLEITSTAL